MLSVRRQIHAHLELLHQVHEKKDLSQHTRYERPAAVNSFFSTFFCVKLKRKKIDDYFNENNDELNGKFEKLKKSPNVMLDCEL